MRFKKGSKVEVLSKEVPSGSWLPAEIVSGNGHYYSVRYYCVTGATEETVVERVSRKAVRPCPPSVSNNGWVAGDLVEMFNNACWRTFEISKVLHGDFYLVRPLGSSTVLKVHKSNIRVRQFWQDDKWVVIEKGSSTCEDGNLKRLATLTSYKKNSLVVQGNGKRKLEEEDDCFAVRGKNCLQESRIFSSRTLHRASPYSLSHVDTCNENVEKMRPPEKKARCHRVPQSSLLQKVGAVAHPIDNMGEKCMHYSLKNQTTEFNGVDRRKVYRLVKCATEKSSEQNDFEGDRSSVGSCSAISDTTNEFSSRMLPGHGHRIDTSCSDAESFCDYRDEEEECPYPSKEELKARIHNLELHAYRSTLEAFYASGPLRWEVEALLFDLRISLNISNDEHLMEVSPTFQDQRWGQSFPCFKV